MALKCLEKAIIPLKALVNNIHLEVTRVERRIDYKCVNVDFVAKMKISRIL